MGNEISLISQGTLPDKNFNTSSYYNKESKVCFKDAGVTVGTQKGSNVEAHASNCMCTSKDVSPSSDGRHNSWVSENYDIKKFHIDLTCALKKAFSDQSNWYIVFTLGIFFCLTHASMN